MNDSDDTFGAPVAQLDWWVLLPVDDSENEKDFAGNGLKGFVLWRPSFCFLLGVRSVITWTFWTKIYRMKIEFAYTFSHVFFFKASFR